MNAFETTTTRLAREELGACTLIQDLLPLYIEGEVSASSRDLIVEHLARCERCAGFLAGAQSVRAQLRRETTQRAAVATANAPIQRVVDRGRLFTTTASTLGACALGSVSSALIAYGAISYPGFTVIGLPLLLVSLFLIGVIAVMRAPLSLVRVLILLSGCFVGGVASVLAFVSESGDMNMLGFMLGLGALVIVWNGIWNVRLPGAKPVPTPFVADAGERMV